MVLLTSPNNPTGTPLPMADIERILAACETADVAGAGEGVHPILVIDEAYVEFRKPGTPSAVSLIKNHPNLAVSRTMSKAFAFAGARVGYLAASKGIIDCVRIVRMPYHLSAVTQAAALAAFEHTDEQLSRVEHLREIRESTAAWLKDRPTRASRSKWPSPVELPAVRRAFRRPRGHLRRAAQARRAHPRGRPGRLAARVHGHRRGDGTIP